MRLMVVSGRSGSGKSVALRVLEDLGYYCVDNLPVHLLPQFVNDIANNEQDIAVSVDIRNMPPHQGELDTIFKNLPNDVDAVSQFHDVSIKCSILRCTHFVFSFSWFYIFRVFFLN